MNRTPYPIESSATCNNRNAVSFASMAFASSSSRRLSSVTSVKTPTVPPSCVFRSLIWIQRPSL